MNSIFYFVVDFSNYPNYVLTYSLTYLQHDNKVALASTKLKPQKRNFSFFEISELHRLIAKKLISTLLYYYVKIELTLLNIDLLFACLLAYIKRGWKINDKFYPF